MKTALQFQNERLQHLLFREYQGDGADFPKMTTSVLTDPGHDNPKVSIILTSKRAYT